MPTIPLTHCEPVTIANVNPPQPFVLTLEVGGAAGDGTVDVGCGGTCTPSPASVGTGDSEVVTIETAAGAITLHYVRADGTKPETVVVTHLP